MVKWGRGGVGVEEFLFSEPFLKVLERISSFLFQCAVRQEGRTWSHDNFLGNRRSCAVRQLHGVVNIMDLSDLCNSRITPESVGHQ